MKPYDCDYSWIDVKKATNNCLNKLYSKCANVYSDIVKDVFSNGLPQAMDKVVVELFQHPENDCDPADIELIRKAYVQLHKVAYIGASKFEDNKK